MKKLLQPIFPENIRCIAVTAPAGKAAPAALELALQELAQVVKVKNYIAQATDDTPSYLAADAAARIACFNNAVNDPEVDLIAAVRGGFGSVHILQEIDYATLRKRNLPVMGYSDITSLHCAMLAKNAGVPCLSVLWGFRDREILEQAGAKHFCCKAEEILPMAEKLMEA